jgi:hypothetical protein
MWSDEQRPLAGATPAGLNRTLIPVELAWLLVGSLLLRLFFATTGAHFDYYSYQLVADFSLQGKNFYVETGRYNYAPLWGWWVTFLRWISGPWFRYGIIATLVAADFYFISWLYQHGRKVPAVLWGLLPIQAAIIGFQNMFDVLGIIPAFLAVDVLERNSIDGRRSQSDKVVLRATLLLGLSMCLKHVFIFFPFWLFFRTPDRRHRAMLLAIPLAVFLLSFVPMLHNGGGAAIRSHVFGYLGGTTTNFWAEIFPDIIARFDKSVPGFHVRSVLFFLPMLLAGVLLRRRPLYESLLLCGVCMFLFNTGRYVHYYTFLLPFLITYRNGWAWVTLVYGSIVILTTPEGTFGRFGPYAHPDQYSRLQYSVYDFIHSNWGLHTSLLLILTWITKDHPDIWKSGLKKFGNQLRDALLYGKG